MQQHATHASAAPIARLQAKPDRLFICHVPTGLAYCDRAVIENGDYRRLALLSFGTLALQIAPSCPADLRSRIEADAARIQARHGELQQVSASGQTVTLGHGLGAAQ